MGLARRALTARHSRLLRHKTPGHSFRPGHSPPRASCSARCAANGTSRPADCSPPSTPHSACHPASGPPGSPRRPARHASRTTPCSSCLPICTGHVSLLKKIFRFVCVLTLQGTANSHNRNSAAICIDPRVPPRCQNRRTALSHFDCAGL